MSYLTDEQRRQAGWIGSLKCEVIFERAHSARTPRKYLSGSNPIDMKIPDKLYFKIGEVSKISGLPAYVLRFWENEFACIRPKRTSAGQRLYRRNDVEMVLKIRHLLHEKKFTIQGAKQHLSSRKTSPTGKTSTKLLTELRTELESIRDLLES